MLVSEPLLWLFDTFVPRTKPVRHIIIIILHMCLVCIPGNLIGKSENVATQSRKRREEKGSKSLFRNISIECAWDSNQWNCATVNCFVSKSMIGSGAWVMSSQTTIFRCWWSIRQDQLCWPSPNLPWTAFRGPTEKTFTVGVRILRSSRSPSLWIHLELHNSKLHVLFSICAKRETKKSCRDLSGAMWQNCLALRFMSNTVTIRAETISFHEKRSSLSC